MPFKIGDSVRVKEGVLCPNYESLCIGGYQGRIFEMGEDDIVGIRWDSITLKQLPLEYIKRSEEEGLGWTEMYLSLAEIEPTPARDSETTAGDVREQMESKYFWLGDGKEGERILTIITDAEDEMEAWNDHLTQVLVFPFVAEVSEPQDRGPLDCGDRVEVKGFAEVVDLYGVLVNVTKDRKHYVFPLCDLTVRDKKSLNYPPVRDYCVWFANQ